MWDDIFDNNPYLIGAVIVGVLVGLGIWIYAIMSWGFLIGIALGWIPGLIGGVIAGFLWPIIAIGLLIIGTGIMGLW